MNAWKELIKHPSKYAVCRENPWLRTLCQNCNMFRFFWEGGHFDSCCATNRKVAGSIPAGVSGFFIDIKFLPIALWP